MHARPMPFAFLALLAVAAVAAVTARAAGGGVPAAPFAVRVVDDRSGRGVPLVYLRTTYKTTYVTDSGGYVAFAEPGLMDGADLWFDVKSYGYESPAGPFGTHGVRLKPTPGGSAEIRLRRTQIAERLYRTTGYGVYRDTVLLGRTAPVEQPLLNARVTGQDTVQTAVYRGKTYWLWQDTDRAGFALGGFSMTGGVSAPPAALDPDRGIDVTYFVDAPGAFARAMARVPVEGVHPVWVDGLTVVPDAAGRERMVARYVAVDADMSPHETGLVVYDDGKEIFERMLAFEGRGRGTLAPSGHPFFMTDAGTRYACYGGVRVKADFASVSDPRQYEAFTCLDDNGKPVRAGGKLAWAWRRGAGPVDFERAAGLVRQKTIAADESPFVLADVESGKPVRPAGGSVAWNPYLRQWTFLFGQSGGASALGEIWFATAASPQGPWAACRKVATHAMKGNDNDLYNPIQHPEFARAGGRFVYFEGTFVNTFSGNPAPTPYYDYNNLMYRLDLADPRLKLPPPPPGLTRVTPDGPAS